MPVSPRPSASTPTSPPSGLGLRSKRYSMLVEDGVVKALNVEESPGQATVSGAAAMLEQL